MLAMQNQGDQQSQGGTRAQYGKGGAGLIVNGEYGHHHHQQHHGFHQHASFHSHQSSIGGYAERHPQRSNIPTINTARITHPGLQSTDMTPGTAYDMNFTPLLPSQLLLGSPFQPGSPNAFASPQFQSFGTFANANGVQQGHGGLGSPVQAPAASISPAMFQSMAAATNGQTGYMQNGGGPQSPTAGGFAAYGGQTMGMVGAQQMGMATGIMTGSTRTVYLGNIPPETSAEEILNHVRSGQIESFRLLPDKNCAFISFLDSSSTTHFHSDAILKRLSIKGQDIKVGWGKPSQVPTSVALAVQQSQASRNVYLGGLPDDITEEEIREDLGKLGAIDTIKLVREKNIAFVHFLSIGNAVKAVQQLPQEAKWGPPRRVYYGKDRCAYVSKTQQQNAAQYLGIAPGYAHMLNGVDRDVITNALAHQTAAAAAVATAAGGYNNMGNRTVYLGNIHPETTIEEICNVVRGGLLHHIRYIPDKHICFVTFIDPTSAASFYALSNIQGLMIHNRRLKIGWGKHSGALPPAIALAVSGGASRNVYIGNLDETWTEDRLRQDFSEFGEIELVNALREKSCAFVNFTNIANAIKAIEAVRGKDEYKRFKINFGKDRCGNPPRQVGQHGGNNGMGNQHEVGSSSPGSGGRGHSPNSQQNQQHPQHQQLQHQQQQQNGMGILTGGNNPMVMYLQQQQQAAQEQAVQQHVQHQHHLSQTNQQLPSATSASSFTSAQAQAAFYNAPTHTSTTPQPSTGSIVPTLHAPSHSFSISSHSHHHHQHSQQPSLSSLQNGLSNGLVTNGIGAPSGLNGTINGSGAPTIGGMLAPATAAQQRAQHSRAVSLPVFTQQNGVPAQHQHPGGAAGQQQQQQHQGYAINAPGLVGYGMDGHIGVGLNGWAEEVGH